MPTLAELLEKALTSPAKRRFADITLGLDMCEAVQRAAAALDARDWPEDDRLTGREYHLSGTLGWTEVARIRLRHSPRGKDGTGKTALETLRRLNRARAELSRALRQNREYAIGVLRREMTTGLAALESELRDRDQLRWVLDTGEERGLLLDRRMEVGMAWREMKRLGRVDKSAALRLNAFDAAVRAVDPTWAKEL